MAGIAHLEQFRAESLRGVVDETVESRPAQFADDYLPTRTIYSRTFAYDIIKTNQHIAALIGYGAEAPVVDRDAVARMHGEIAKMGVKYIVTEEELLAIMEGRQGERSSTIERLVLKGADLVEYVQKRIDVMKLEALTKGSFRYNDGRVNIDIDFGVPAEHKIALAPGADWNETDRDAIQDLLDAVEVYRNTNGQDPEVMLMRPETFAKLQRNAVVILEAGRPEGVTRASQQDVRDVMTSYGLPEIQIVNQSAITVKKMDEEGFETIEYLPVNRVVMLSQGIGEFLMGITVENGGQPGISLTAHDKDEPIASILKAVAAGFPAVERPELILHLDVFTP